MAWTSLTLDCFVGFVANFHWPDFPLCSALNKEVVEERG